MPFYPGRDRLFRLNRSCQANLLDFDGQTGRKYCRCDSTHGLPDRRICFLNSLDNLAWRCWQPACWPRPCWVACHGAVRRVPWPVAAIAAVGHSPREKNAPPAVSRPNGRAVPSRNRRQPNQRLQTTRPWRPTLLAIARRSISSRPSPPAKIASKRTKSTRRSVACSLSSHLAAMLRNFPWRVPGIRPSQNCPAYLCTRSTVAGQSDTSCPAALGETAEPPGTAAVSQLRFEICWLVWALFSPKTLRLRHPQVRKGS